MNRIELRNWNDNDLERLIELADNVKIYNNMTDSFPHPYTREKGQFFIEMAKKSESSKIKAITFSGELVGSIGLHPQHDIQKKNAELGYWIGEPYWNNGIATEAVKLMTAWGFENMSISRIFAKPFGTNIGSQKVLEKAGFKLEAVIKEGFFKNDNYVDELIYSIRPFN